MKRLDLTTAEARSGLTGLPLADVLERDAAERTARPPAYVEPRLRTYRGCTITLDYEEDEEAGRIYSVHHPSRAEDLGRPLTLDRALRLVDSLIARGFIPAPPSHL